MKDEWKQMIDAMRDAGYAVWWFMPHELERCDIDAGTAEDWMADALVDIQQYHKNGG
jgi:hypothetical protein